MSITNFKTAIWWQKLVTVVDRLLLLTGSSVFVRIVEAMLVT